MGMDTFKEAVDSMVEFPKMTGMMGGEPLMHPQFREMCAYMRSRIPADQCGLWTCLPKGYEHYRSDIVETFGNVFINNHSRPDILHGPVLVSSEELPGSEHAKWELIDNCWIQNYWSASINPKGAFFCEVAAALAMLLDEKDHKGWPVKSGWYNKIPKDYKEQMEKYCSLCGCAIPLKRRPSTDGKDDISPDWIKKLKEKSPKVKQGKYVEHNLLIEPDDRKMATYKETEYRSNIAKEYGIFLMLNKTGFQRPYLIDGWQKGEI